MPQGLAKMPLLDMWDYLKKGDFWLIDNQQKMEAPKNI